MTNDDQIITITDEALEKILGIRAREPAGQSMLMIWQTVGAVRDRLCQLPIACQGSIPPGYSVRWAFSLHPRNSAATVSGTIWMCFHMIARPGLVMFLVLAIA